MPAVIESSEVTRIVEDICGYIDLYATGFVRVPFDRGCVWTRLDQPRHRIRLAGFQVTLEALDERSGTWEIEYFQDCFGETFNARVLRLWLEVATYREID